MAPSDPVVFITGCSNGGIGAALVVEFAARGCIVYATSRTVASMSALTHPNVRKLAVDVTDDAAVAAAVAHICAAAGRIDVAVSNAGLGCVAPLLDVSVEQTRRVLDTNVLGFARVAHAVLPHMAARRAGLVVAVGSILGELGTPFSGVYNASKAALHAYAEALALEAQPLGVNVLLLSPGAVKSNIASKQTYIMPDDSLYQAFQAQITRRMFLSQTGKGSMDTAVFAKRVVDKALSRRPPRYLTLGGNARFWWFLSWLPRWTALQLIWRSLTKP